MNTNNGLWNETWSNIIVEELARNGITFFCVSPGWRSAPLSLAVGQNSKITIQICTDERAAAFLALGYGKATGHPAGLIATSGTAVANYLPAVVEASMSHVPMLLLTADRPPELHECGANQAIRQNDLFQHYVRWSHSLACPGPEMPINALVSTLCYAVHCAQSPLSGPVHLNFPFREPFLSSHPQKIVSLQLPQGWEAEDNAYVSWSPAQKLPDEAIIDALLQARPARGILSVGRIPLKARSMVERLAEALNWPVFVDINSGLRLGKSSPLLIAHYDALLIATEKKVDWEPEAIWHFGLPPVSKRWLQVWENTQAQQMVWIADHSLRHDSTHRFRWQIESDIGAFCASCTERLPSSSEGKAETAAWLGAWQALELRTEALMEEYFDCFDRFDKDGAIVSEAAISRLLSHLIPKEHGLFIGNSLPIRMMDTYTTCCGKGLRAASNRGASGIDGVIASTAGYAQGLRQAVTLLIGDLSALHDLNSLALVQQSSFPVIIVLFNNHGGGIFSFLPVAKETSPLFEKLFTTPQNYNFEAASQAFHLNYHRADSMATFRESYQTVIASKGSALIEVSTNCAANPSQQEQWQAFFLEGISSELESQA